MLWCRDRNRKALHTGICGDALQFCTPKSTPNVVLKCFLRSCDVVADGRVTHRTLKKHNVKNHIPAMAFMLVTDSVGRRQPFLTHIAVADIRDQVAQSPKRKLACCPSHENSSLAIGNPNVSKSLVSWQRSLK